jgi:hypothetical protein
MKNYVEIKDVFFVEDKIKSLKYYPTPNELWKELKGRFRTKNELGTIIDYFLNENMIILDKGKIVLIHNPPLNRLLKMRGYIVL